MDQEQLVKAIKERDTLYLISFVEAGGEIIDFNPELPWQTPYHRVQALVSSKNYEFLRWFFERYPQEPETWREFIYVLAGWGVNVPIKEFKYFLSKMPKEVFPTLSFHRLFSQAGLKVMRELLKYNWDAVINGLKQLPPKEIKKLPQRNFLFLTDLGIIKIDFNVQNPYIKEN